MDKMEIPSEIGNYLILDQIGSGSSAIVHLALNFVTNATCCVKLIPKSKIRNQKDEEHLCSEIRILQSIVHPNVIQFYEFYDSQNFFCLFQEYFQGYSLLEYVNMQGPLPEDQTKKIFYQLLSVVDFLHQNKISHRDIKLENILLDQNLKIKLIDFGLSIFANELLSTYCGSLHYTAPECILYQPYSGFFADMWSLGVVLFGMITGQLPWMDHNLKIVASKIVKLDYFIPDDVPVFCANIISRLLVLNPETRMPADECLTQPWFDEDFVKEMKQFIDEGPPDIIPNPQYDFAVQIKSNFPSIEKRHKNHDDLRNQLKFQQNPLFNNAATKRNFKSRKSTNQFKSKPPPQAPLQQFDFQTTRITRNKKCAFVKPSQFVAYRRRPGLFD